MPPITFARCSPPSRPPLPLSVATKLTYSPPFRPESMITTGILLRIALVTGPTSALSSRGASTIPDTPAHEAFDLGDLAVPVVLAQGPAPDDLRAHLARRP